MNNQNYWNHRRGNIRSRKGGWNIGHGVTDHGYSLLDDLLGHISFFQLLILHVTGKLPERRLADWLEASFMCLSWPDPRIWCNQIGSLGGSAQTSSTAAVCAGTLAADSRIYGTGTLINATRFIQRAAAATDVGISISEFIEIQCKAEGRLIVPGYARPIAKGDERVIAMQAVEEKLTYTPGKHLTLGYQINDYLYEIYEESMNFAGYVVAFLADQNFSETEIARVFSLWVNNGVHACYVEAADRPANSFLPLRCDDILYTGCSERPFPAKQPENV